MKHLEERVIKRHLVSGTITVIAITVLTLAGELNEPLQNLLKQLFSHHWLGKSILALIIFFLFAHVFKLPIKKDTHSLVNLLVTSTTLATIVIIAFFVWHELK